LGNNNLYLDNFVEINSGFMKDVDSIIRLSEFMVGFFEIFRYFTDS